jgi:archaeal flagellin FlaB
MFENLKQRMQDERGLSALETAIVLIAFVVVAAVFAFTMLSAGMFSTERSKEAVYAGLEEVRGLMELRGSVIAETDATKVTTLTFTVGNVAGGAPVNLTTGADKTLVIGYRDEDQVKNNLEWNVDFLGNNDGDDLLEQGELAEITVGLGDLTTDLGTSTLFVLELKPSQGGTMVLERRTPDSLDTIIDLQ